MLVGHGSRDAQTRVEHDALEARMRAQFPHLHVASGFIELSEPPLSLALEQIAHACEHVVVAPLLLFAGGHMQRDVPNAIAHAQAQVPRTRFVVTEPFGLSAYVLQLASARIAGQLVPGESTTIVLVGRGAAEPGAQQSFQRVRQCLADRHPAHRFVTAYCGVQQPDVATVLRELRESGAQRVLVKPYLLFTGRLLNEIASAVQAARAQQPTLQITLCNHLGPDIAPALVEALAAAFTPKS